MRFGADVRHRGNVYHRHMSGNGDMRSGHLRRYGVV